MAPSSYKYLRADFAPLPVGLRHLTIYLNFHADWVETDLCLEMTAHQPLSQVALDARDLKILSVLGVSGPQDQGGAPLEYDYQAKNNRLVVKLAAPVAQGDSFALRTRTRCFPSDNLLEGIYRDVTPPGAPPQFISQCQQWGFQRIMPIIDDCRAKCTMTTTLEGNADYTHLISNGNVDRERNPQGRPVPKPGEPGRKMITFVNPAPMAPYLFIAAAGTWDELADQVVYPSGRKVRLEYLVPPGRVEDARLPMEILKDSVLWVARSQGYEYPGDTYRTICMTRSNFGGMENMGNTTIVTDAALIDPEHTDDASLMYAHAVVVHEFYHNQCGSQTTMATPFDMWLNEAYTVDVERRYMASRFDPTLMRLREVDSVRSPLLGPLVMEDSGAVGRIVRQGFNDPDELVDGVTYVKAAEVISMLRALLGSQVFDQGKDLYFSRYKDGNADSDQFFACFEEVSGRSLDQFKAQWLYTIGYPRVSARTSFDPAAQALTIQLEQSCPQGVGPFPLPVSLALVDEKGQDVPGSARVCLLEDWRKEITIPGLASPPALVSLNRDYSFYGSFEQQGLSPQDLANQAALDPNLFNRVEAMRRLTDRQRVALMENPQAQPDPLWLETHGRLLAQTDLPAGVKAYLLRIDEQPLDRQYLAWYPEQVAAKRRLWAELNQAFGQQLVDAYLALDTRSPRPILSDGLEERMLAGVLLEIIASRDDAPSQQLVLDHFQKATTAADRVTGLLLLNRTSSPKRKSTLAAARKAWKGHLSGRANYLRVVSSGTNPDVFDMIEQEKKAPDFDLATPTWCRSLLVPMAVNNAMLWTEKGVAWLADQIIQLAPINMYTAGRLLNALQLRARLRQPLQSWADAALDRILAKVPEEVAPALHHQARTYRGL